MTLDPAVRAFLEEPRYAVLATINRDGSPHLTEMWYDLRGDEIIFNTTEERQKKQNLARDTRVSLLVAGRRGEPVWKALKYVRVDGRARRIADGAQAFEDIVRLAIRYDGPSAEATARETFATAHRVTYALPVRRVYAKGFAAG